MRHYVTLHYKVFLNIYILTWRVTDTIQYAFQQYLVRNRAAYSLSVIRLPTFMMLYSDLVCLCYCHRGRKRPMQMLVVSKSYKNHQKRAVCNQLTDVGLGRGESVLRVTTKYMYLHKWSTELCLASSKILTPHSPKPPLP